MNGDITKTGYTEEGYEALSGFHRLGYGPMSVER
jgi:hypothetical protein